MKNKIDFAEINNLPIEIVDYLTKTKTLFCKCGEYKKVYALSASKIGYGLYHSCGKPECNSRYGIKRPGHSAFMKNLAASGANEKYNATLIKSGERHNAELNSIEFKNKVLLSTGFNGTFSQYLGARNKDVNNRRKQIMSRYNMWEDQYKELIKLVCQCVPTTEWCDTLTEDQVQYYWKRLHGINTIRNCDNSQEVGRSLRFKGEYVRDLKFNYTGLTIVKTRSSWETELIKIFEKKRIEWSYEEFRIGTVDHSGFYIPDFVAKIKNKTYMIEVKGGYFATDKEWYMKNKIAAGVNFCKQRNWSFCMVWEKPQNLDFVKTPLIGD